jgi:thiol-disulfide isomerase/thioredoxin
VLVAAAAVVAIAGRDGEDDLPDPAEVAALPIVPLTGGEPQPLGDLLGDRPVVLNLFASWCQPCIQEMPAFEQVHQDLGDEVSFAGLAVSNPPDDALRIVERTGVTYPTFDGADDADDSATVFEVEGMPTTVFIGADGTVEDIHGGELTEAELRAAIERRFGVAS